MTSCDFEFTAPSDLFHWDEHLATYNVRQQITVATLALNKMGFKNDPRVSFARLTLSDDKKKMTVRLAVSNETEDEVKDFLTSRHYEVSESEVNKATFRVSPLDACFSCLLIQEAFEKSAPSVEVVRVTGVPDACWVQVAHNEIRSLIDNNWTFSGRPLFWLKKLPGKERICTLCYKRDHSAKNCPQQPLATCYRCLASMTGRMHLIAWNKLLALSVIPSLTLSTTALRPDRNGRLLTLAGSGTELVSSRSPTL